MASSTLYVSYVLHALSSSSLTSSTSSDVLHVLRRPWCPLCIYPTSVTPVVPEASTSHPPCPPRFLCPGHPALYIPLGLLHPWRTLRTLRPCLVVLLPVSSCAIHPMSLCPLRPQRPIRPLRYPTASLTSHVWPSILPTGCLLDNASAVAQLAGGLRSCDRTMHDVLFLLYHDVPNTPTLMGPC